MDQRFLKLILLLCSLFFLPGRRRLRCSRRRAAASSCLSIRPSPSISNSKAAGNAELADPPRLLPVSPADQTGAAAGDARRLYPARRVEPQGRVLRRSGDFQTAAESAGAAATGGANASLSVTYQGCAEAGFCYPPETRIIPLDAVSAGTAAPLPAVNTAPTEQPATPASLPFSPLWALLIGIGIAFTPCVLPMYPLISGIILGRDRPQSSGRILALAVVYVQGMALTYTLLGLVGRRRSAVPAALQHPYVLIGLSVLFIALALSMFGLYSCSCPRRCKPGWRAGATPSAAAR